MVVKQQARRFAFVAIVATIMLAPSTFLRAADDGKVITCTLLTKLMAILVYLKGLRRDALQLAHAPTMRDAV